MLGKVHAGTFAVAAIGVFKWDISLMFLAGGIIGSYGPDMDIETSKAGKIIPMWRWCKHREQTHSLYFATVCGVLAGTFNLSLGLGIFSGMLLHMFMDCCTPMGAVEGMRYALWPWKNHYKETLYRKPNIKRYALKK